MNAALFGFALILVSFVFAGIAMAPMFNRFRAPGQAPRSKAGCMWLLVSALCIWFGVWLLLSVPAVDPNAPDWQADTTNIGDQ